MAVSLQVSETLDGAAISDALAGGGTGLDLGSVVNNSYAPVVSKAGNTGKQDLYISHDATVDQITDVKAHLQQFGVGTGFTYGGADTAANDFTSIKALGQASTEAATDKNNANGTSGGFWMEMDSDVATATQFDPTRTSLLKIFGNNGTDGIDLASAFVLAAEAMVYAAAGEQQASAPVAGEIGKAADTVLGDSAHLAFRIYLPSSHTSGGILQFETVFVFSFTA